MEFCGGFKKGGEKGPFTEMPRKKEWNDRAGKEMGENSITRSDVRRQYSNPTFFCSIRSSVLFLRDSSSGKRAKTCSFSFRRPPTFKQVTASSRTQVKQMLLREQCLQQEQKERQRQQQQQQQQSQAMAIPAEDPASAVAPAAALGARPKQVQRQQELQQVPPEVFKVTQTHIFHICIYDRNIFVVFFPRLPPAWRTLPSTTCWSHRGARSRSSWRSHQGHRQHQEWPQRSQPRPMPFTC